MLRKTRLPNTNTVGIYLPCLPEDQVPGKPYCVYEPKKEFKERAAPKSLKERRSWIKKNQPKGFPKHYASAEEAKKAIRMMKAYGGGWRPPRTTGRSGLNIYDKQKVLKAILAIEISLPIWAAENPEDADIITILDKFTEYSINKPDKINELSTLAAEIIEDFDDIETPGDHVAMAVALLTRFDAEGAITYASQAFVEATSPGDPQTALDIFYNYLEILIKSKLS